MKIVITDCNTITTGDLSLDLFKELGDVKYYGVTPQIELAGILSDADAVICNKAQITREIIEKSKNLKYIGLFATGYNNIDIDCAREKGVTVCNAGSYSTGAVTQHTFSLMLELLGSTAKYIDFTQNGGWKTCPTFSGFSFPQYEIQGKTLGIIGYGAIGQSVAKVAAAFGMKVLAFTRTPKNDPAVTFTDLDSLLKDSDIISVHCPLTTQTDRMFNKDTFSKCKDGAYFINTSRGGVVGEEDLRDALISGKLAGAAIDVLTEEPMAKNSVLSDVPNLIITPHIAWAPFETRKRLLNIVFDNLQCFIKGEPKNVVS